MNSSVIQDPSLDRIYEEGDRVQAERYLTILEVSQKQAYIFASNKLRENEKRSAEIAWLTAPESIQELVNDPDVFDYKTNTVYSGGGHTVFTFETYEKAKAFNCRYSFLVRTMNPEIEVFLYTMPYCSKAVTEDGTAYTPSRYLKELVSGLERKKALRQASFRQGSFGLRKLMRTHDPLSLEEVGNRSFTEAILTAVTVTR